MRPLFNNLTKIMSIMNLSGNGRFYGQNRYLWSNLVITEQKISFDTPRSLLIKLKVIIAITAI